MSIIIGINAYHADSSASIFINGKLLFAIEEEKLNRQKHWAGIPSESIKACLKFTGINANDVTDVSINSDPFSNLNKKIPYFLNNYIFGKKKYEIINRLKNKFSLKKYLLDELNFNKDLKIHYIDHHLSHIASSYFPSNFEEALAISVDGFGDFASINIARCNKDRIDILKKVYFPHSLGIFYEMMTQLLGFKKYGDEYKLMGLSSYGKPNYVKKIKKNIFIEKKFLELNPKYFLHLKKDFSYKFQGIPNQNDLFSEEIYKIFSKEEIQKNRSDIASSTQKIYEEYLINIINFSKKLYDSKNLCISGGCALNSSANGKILDNTEIENIFVPYSPGDAGGSIGSALVVLQKKYNHQKIKNLLDPFLGPKFENNQIEKEIEKIDKEKFKFEKIDDEILLCEKTAKNIAAGKIVGWFQGKIEFGARALGNRSILADPRNQNIRELINSKIKKREDFRPFAPSILSEHKSEWFNNDYSNLYMEAVLNIKKNKASQVPAIVHVDHTCRLQSVHSDMNPLFHQLIKSFYLITDVPMLLNTSFNENEPIVCHPKEAIDCFLRTNMDVIVLGNFIITR